MDDLKLNKIKVSTNIDLPGLGLAFHRLDSVADVFFLVGVLFPWTVGNIKKWEVWHTCSVLQSVWRKPQFHSPHSYRLQKQL